jgi:Putative peptidoglycan binding domain
VTNGQRDLACDDLWAGSLERSLVRRRRNRRASGELWRLQGPRDLSHDETFHDSLEFSRARREAVANSSDLPAPAARGLSLAALLAVTAGPTFGVLAGAGAAQAAPHSSSLHEGASGSSVARLQRALGVTSDGSFGPVTLRALRRFQARHGLTVDGIAGPQTWSALGRAGHMSLASSSVGGGGVATLQRVLGIGADGVFGPQTEQAVRSFQSGHGLTVDGIVGPATRSALGLGDGPTLRRGGGHHGGGNGTPGEVARMVSAGNQIAGLPYIYGGGHGSFSASGYDCSGSVSYVLHAAGLLSSPQDSGSLESYGESGPGRYVTIYANGGHAWMTINGRRFDTSAMSSTGSRWSSSMGSTGGFVVRHPQGL